MSYSKEGKFVFFRHGDEHDMRLTEMYVSEKWKNGKVMERIGSVIHKHITSNGAYPCTEDKSSCEGCIQGVDRSTAFKTPVIIESGECKGQEKVFEIPVKLHSILLEKQKTFKDTCDNDQEVLSAVYRIKKNAKGSDPLWTVNVIGKPKRVEVPKTEAVDLDALDETPATDAEGNTAAPADVTFTKAELEQVANYNAKIGNALKTTPTLDVAGSLRKSLTNVAKLPKEKVDAVIAAIGADKLVDLNSLKLSE